eukprot:TRINITY_DN1198_c0_g1_i1.p2 TRINITY_DN1198_c0_g1~~TRINITY_DN1198_c0_g1_i1.p2  ORF type:complete len:700 (-),score=161.39 TRINITY_DN1198_c0_g1_i1:20-2119(-)
MDNVLPVVAGVAVVGGAAWAVAHRPPANAFYAEPPAFHSYVVPNSAQPGSSPIYRNPASVQGLLRTWSPEIRTAYDSFSTAAKTHASKPMLGTREYLPGGKRGDYKWKTYAQIQQDVTALGSALVQLGLQRGARVGIYMINSEEWVVTAQALNAYGFVSVALYDTLGPDAVQYVIKDASVECCVCTKQNTPKILESAAQLPTLKFIIEVDNLRQGATASLPTIRVVPYPEALAMGKSNPAPHSPPQPEDLYTINYTSGTTGNPKGVLLTHANLIAAVAGLFATDDAANKIHPSLATFSKAVEQHAYVSYLPLAHMYERFVHEGLFPIGASIGFFQGDVEGLMNDIATIRPTIFASVPRILNRVYDKITGAVEASGGIKKKLFDVGYAAKISLLRRGCITRDTLWDRVVFAKVRDVLGGRVESIITGSAPIAPHVLDFYRAVFGCKVLEGYGMSETAAAGSTIHAADYVAGTVGLPSPCMEIKLVDVPEMNYLTTNKPPCGEICFRGPAVTQGYYNLPQITAETIDSDGWLHSGDIGRWNANGTLTIFDRKKNIFKLAQGEYVAPEKIENIYARSRFVMQIFVHGDSLQNQLVAVVIPDPDTAKEWAAANSVQFNLPALCANVAFRAAVLKDMDAVGKAAELRPFEFAKSVRLVAEPFSVATGQITPTFKLIRNACKKIYEPLITEMYAELAAVPSKSKL